MEELALAFLAQLPGDALADGPLRYRAEPNDTYLLYSVGWNQIDDGGKIVLRSKSNRRDDEKGDWVWVGGSLGAK